MSILNELKSSARGLAILYVEDETDLRKGTEQFLKKFFSTVDTAEDGVEGVKRRQQRHYDIILSDINMPGMSGLEFLQRVKEGDAPVQTIILSAHDDKELLLEAIEVGVDYYILKPADRNLLGATLLKCIKAIRLREELEAHRQLTLQQSRAASQEELLMYIAHHWRQPLNNLGLSIQSLQMDFEEKKVDQTYIDSLVERDMLLINELSETIEQFRSFYTPNYDQTFNILKATIETMQLLINAFEDESVTVSYRLCDEKELLTTAALSTYDTSRGGLMIRGNANDFKQLLFALTTNAKEAIARNIAKGGISHGEMLITFIEEGEMCRFIIEDNGGGMDKETMEQATLPFFTTDNMAKKKGLGLYLAHMIVTKKMSGSLTLANSEKGLRATITLPKHPD